MELVISIIVGILLFGLWFANNKWGIRCPVCKSTRHWSIGYFGSNKQADKVICKKCYRSTYSPQSKEMKEFDLPQEVTKSSKPWTRKMD